MNYMIRRLIIVLLTLLPGVCALAQNVPGQWNAYSVYSDALDQVIETPDKVYYVSSGCLYSYDSRDGETYAYTSFNKLNGNNILRIAYNYDKNYLCIVYSDANVDLLYDDGRVVNMSDIRDATIGYAKRLIDLKIRPEGIFISAGFGYVVFDDEKYLVKDSAVYGSETDFVDTDGEFLYLLNNGAIMISPLDSHHNSLSSFTYFYNLSPSSLWVLDTRKLIYVRASDSRLCYLFIDPQAGLIDDHVMVDAAVAPLQPCKDGYFTYSSDKIYVIGPDGSLLRSLYIPAPLRGKPLSFYDTPDKIYTAAGGLGRYDISGDVPEVLMEPFVEQNVLTCRHVAFLIPSVDGKRIYVSNLGSSGWNGVAEGDDFANSRQKVNLIENFTVSDITPAPGITYDNPTFDDVKSAFAPDEVPMFGPAGMAVEDPDDPSVYYVCNGLEGVFVIKDGVQIAKINSTNAKISPTWGARGGRTFSVAFDPAGNMYVGSEYNKNGSPAYQPVIMLPAAKRRSRDWTVGDWTELPLKSSFAGNKDIRTLFCRHSRMAFFIDGMYNGMLVAYDTNGSYTNVADDKHIVWETLTDQDGKEFRPENYTCLVEDKNGRVWVGTSEGVVEITSPRNAVSPDFRINRIKVPRNDGTNLADYLLSTDLVTSIAVDHSNRKWISTEASGIYLVSENGDEILQHFTKDNSYLPTNAVYTLLCDPLSNTLYAGTADGLYSYGMNSSPGGESYSDVLAYPNPVRPDYQGDITIRGLMDNSLVKIADSNGSVVAQMRSEGGMVTWDGCNADGRQVRSGVYYVFASQNAAGNTAAVTKILIIR